MSNPSYTEIIKSFCPLAVVTAVFRIAVRTIKHYRMNGVNGCNFGFVNVNGRCVCPVSHQVWNGTCLPKCDVGYIRSLDENCEPELCMESMNWLYRPVSIGCYFHWSLLIVAGIIFIAMVGYIIFNLLNRNKQTYKMYDYCRLY